MGGFIARALIYLVLGAALAQIPFLEAQQVNRAALFSELNYTELTQSAMLLCATLLAFYKASRDDGFRELAVCMALSFLVLLIRENDQTIEMVAPHGTWKYIAIFPMFACLAFYLKNRSAVAEQLNQFVNQRSFGILLGGLSVLMFSRLFGRTSFWQAVMADHFAKIAKKAAEEGVELMALGLILAAIVEFTVFSRSQRSNQTDAGSTG